MIEELKELGYKISNGFIKLNDSDFCSVRIYGSTCFGVPITDAKTMDDYYKSINGTGISMRELYYQIRSRKK